ncbi:hypothetical protein GCM10014715_20820 [Streptomyces spiralis]|uniref:Uncharacterized protein n=1 Tax=Streptomyces spiralis TaxID=66376 RepID=A0A918ZTB5_9ACTN|nr:hypothetical protein GCM10014715_20820 [Streptomyces spiralis]
MVTRTEVGEAPDRVTEALAGASEDEVVALPSELAVSRPRPPALSAYFRTPPPAPGEATRIVSEVEWI